MAFGKFRSFNVWPERPGRVLKMLNTMGKLAHLSLAVLVAAGLSINSAANATPASIGLGSFSGSETVIDFIMGIFGAG